MKKSLIFIGKVFACFMVWIAATITGTAISAILYPMSELAWEAHEIGEVFMPWAL